MHPTDVYDWTGDVLAALRRALDDHGFTEILPAILSERFEPGARHTVAVLGDRALPTVDVGDDHTGSTPSTTPSRGRPARCPTPATWPRRPTGPSPPRPSTGP